MTEKRDRPEVGTWIAYAPLSGQSQIASGEAWRPEKGPTTVRLSPDYNAPSPLWPSSDATDSLVPETLLAKLVAWQEDFDANFRWDTGWLSEESKQQWAQAAEVLEAELREALVGKAELVVDLWPLDH